MLPDSQKSQAQLIEELDSLRSCVATFGQHSEDTDASFWDDILQSLYTAPIGLCHLDTDLRFILINQWLADINGLSVEQHLGRKIGEVLPAVAAGAEAQFRYVIETGKPILEGMVAAEISAHAKAKRHFQHSYLPVKSHEGNVVGITCVVQDITKQKQTEEAIRQRENELAHVSRLSMMGEMVAGIAHEVNQPLYAISNHALACSKTLQQDPQGNVEQALECSRQISAQATRAAEIIRRFGQFTRKTSALSDRLDINEVVGESIELVISEMRRYHVRVDLELAPGQLYVHGDRIQLQQVLVNLLKNACEAMEPIPIVQRSTKIRTAAKENRIHVSILDNGPGIPREEIPRLFRAFHSTKPEGMGMGLAISRSIITSHEGQIWATPNPETGMTFHFSLPTQEDDEEE